MTSEGARRHVGVPRGHHVGVPRGRTADLHFTRSYFGCCGGRRACRGAVEPSPKNDDARGAPAGIPRALGHAARRRVLVGEGSRSAPGRHRIGLETAHVGSERAWFEPGEAHVGLTGPDKSVRRLRRQTAEFT